MLSLYEILKASKTGIAPDMWTALAGMNWGGADSGHEVKELTGIPPLSFTADGTPLIDYLISGNMSQSGTPTPTTPIQPSECGERTGNLTTLTEVTHNGYVKILNPADAHLFDNIEYGTEYTLSWEITSTSTTSVYNQVRFLRSNSTSVKEVNNGGSFTLTSAEMSEIASIAFYFGRNNTNGRIYNIMLNTGSTPLPYEPYGYKIPISSANTTTPVYLGEVETTRNVVKYEFTGQENWQAASGFFYLGSISPDYLRARNTITYVCTHYTAYPQTGFGINVPDKNIALGSDAANQRVYVKDDDMADVTAFKTYLQQQYAAGTPVTVWYVLATPETGIVNEPLRKIGDYADTVSMEQAGVSISTLNGQTVVDVDTTLKPSEMYIKYKG